MTVVITYIRIIDNNQIFILLDIICDAKIFFAEKKKNLEQNISPNFLCLRRIRQISTV